MIIFIRITQLLNFDVFFEKTRALMSLIKRAFETLCRCMCVCMCVREYMHMYICICIGVCNTLQDYKITVL